MYDLADFADESFVCFTGGGGKTTLLRRLSDRLKSRGPVIVATTTKMGDLEVEPSETLLGDVSDSEIKKLLAAQGRAFLFQELKGDRYYGFPPDAVASFYERGLAPFVLAEADGARRRPLKGYAEYEPPLPARFDFQMIVVGVDAFLHPMNEQTVARFEIVQRFLDVGTDEMLTPPLLLKLLTSPDMYLKNSPPETKRILCINKADLTAPGNLTLWTDYLRLRLEGYFGICVTGRNREEIFVRL